MSGYLIADDRTVLRIEGEDRVDFLQGIISNDATKIEKGKGLWAAFLTPQGKYLHDFFLTADGNSILLDCASERAADLHKRLRRYTLRSQVSVAVDPTLCVALVIGVERAPTSGMKISAYADPRHPDMGYRLIGPADGLAATLASTGLEQAQDSLWQERRLRLGLPDGVPDFEVERSTLAEGNADLLGAIDWQKGCWMGQEVTARMYYRGLAKRRLVPMTVDGSLPTAGTPVTLDGAAVGECRSGAGDVVLVFAKTAVIDSAVKGLKAGGAALTPAPPDWLITALSGSSQDQEAR